MKSTVVIESVSAVKPSIIRVAFYTYNADDETDSGIKNYELALPIQDFTKQQSPTDVEINVDRFQEIVSLHVAELQDTANLAKALEAANLTWNIEAESIAVKEKERTKNGKKLAYGGEK